ncbi:glycerophosphoinositol inositolphosphodiesterase GDPD2 isoform X2 [Engraulis encrasicolus]|uniref:glycerophosphoinositol inositolphosphodiesterase GDPD2 isoform X2 n=1 Tax=Engraulis encrasicolus TaxID=184585 RepID=UPI002FD19974
MSGALRTCTRGCYSCYWKRSSERKRRCAGCGFSYLAVMTLLTAAWLFIWMALYNDRDDMNTKAFEILSKWINWFMVIVIISAVLAIYCLLLLIFALFQYSLKEPLDLHCVHKATGPFLQLGAVVAMTLLSWVVFNSFFRSRRIVSKVLIMLAWGVVTSAVFLCPLLIHNFSPCIRDDLPPKPALIGHRGAPMVAPENTMMSFRRSLECNVTAFETDVQLSKDDIPFLFHDKTSLKRTTNVKEKFPDPEREKNKPSNFTFDELRSLNAGQGFLRKDPLQVPPALSKSEKSEVGNQAIPSLNELLDLAKEHNVSIIFDLKNEKSNNSDANYTVQTILASGIPQELIWWLPPGHRAEVKRAAPGFRQVYGSLAALREDGGSHLNVKYNSLSAVQMEKLRSKNVSINLWVVNEQWLYSLAWCSGATSVTTNVCHTFNDMSQPNWQLGRLLYMKIWISADLVSLVIMFGLFLLQREKAARRQIFHLESERTVPLLAL